VKLLLKLIVVLAAAVVTVIVGALAAIRWQIEPALTGVRKLNKALTNRGALRAAGTESSGTAVVVHRGRRSGKTFRTPVHLDGFRTPSSSRWPTATARTGCATCWPTEGP